MPSRRTLTAAASSAQAPGTRRRVRAFLQSQRAHQESFLSALVKQPSDNPPGDCGPHADRAAALLEGLGFQVERHRLPDELVKAQGMISCTNLIVRERFGLGGPTIALNAHGDVVPPGEGWTRDPYGAEVSGGTMYGRGVATSKSDFATYAYALLALKNSGAALTGSVELHFTYDEEAGGLIGPSWLLEQGTTRPDFAICAGFSYGITTSHNGCLHLEVQVRGKSGHAAEPSKGRDALEATSAILSDLYAYRKALSAKRSSVKGIGSPTLVVGLIAGGTNTNVVPDQVTFRLDRRIVPDEDPSDAERALRSLITKSARRVTGTRVSVRRILFAKPFVRRPGQQHIVNAIARNVRDVFGIAIRQKGVPLYTDARHYSEAGIPTVLYGAGPRTLVEARGHRADERLNLGDLHGATQVVALSLLDLMDIQDPAAIPSAGNFRYARPPRSRR